MIRIDGSGSSVGICGGSICIGAFHAGLADDFKVKCVARQKLATKNPRGQPDKGHTEQCQP